MTEIISIALLDFNKGNLPGFQRTRGFSGIIAMKR